MAPDERSLVERYKNQPFAILGIDVDSDRAMARLAAEEDGQSWPSWSDSSGRIAGRWNIDGLPTVYVLDAQGVIRYHHEGRPTRDSLERVIDRLMPAPQTVQARLGQ